MAVTWDEFHLASARDLESGADKIMGFTHWYLASHKFKSEDMVII